MFKMEFQVDYVDTDAMGVVHHSRYFRWFERVRVEWLRSIGLSYREMELEGYILPLSDASIKYRRPLYFDDRPTIEVSVKRIRIAGVELEYKIYVRGELATTASTSHVVCKKGEGEEEGEWNPVRIPEKWRTIWLAQTVEKS